MDKISAKQRSENMRKIKGQDTTPEMIVRKIVFSMGYRYRLHVAALPGKPDLVFQSKRKVIFVHGCFWHQHPNCPASHWPKSNVAYWGPKLERNKQRDVEVQKALKEAGWQVLVIWECETANPESLRSRIRYFLEE